MNNRKRWVSILAGIMAAVMLLSLLLSLIPTRARALSSSEIQEQINELEDQKKELQDQMDELAAQQKSNLSSIQEILEQKNLIDQQIALLQAQIQNINDQIAAQNLLIADTQDALDAAEARLAELNEKNKERIRTMEEEGSLSYWSVLFKSSSFSDLLDRLNMIEEIAAADQRRLKEMRKAAEQVEKVRDELTQEKGNLEVTKADLADSQALLDGKREEADALILELLARGDELAALMEEYENREYELLEEIAAQEEAYNQAKEEEYQQWLSTSVPQNSGNNSSGGDYFVGGNWISPCSYVYVSSPFQAEGRLHPVLGYVRPHNGIDLAAYEGTPIYAVRGGTVTTATYDSGAGYYVSINHGDGFSSIYMHMTHYVVSAGEYVSQGEVIGYVGSTGLSTGAHLHFGISKNGTYVNPANYIAF